MFYHNVSLGILAGGQATRLKGADKAFLQYENQYLCRRILDRINVGFADRFISTRQIDFRFRAMDLVPVFDKREAFSGPLAGIEALLDACKSDYLLTIPVDLKYLPVDCICSWLDQPVAPGMVLQDMNGLQPLLALWHVDSARIKVSNSLDRQEKSVQSVIKSLHFSITERTDFQIGNLNTPLDFETP